jgi:hypothetical protein
MFKNTIFGWAQQTKTCYVQLISGKKLVFRFNFLSESGT